MPQWVAIAYFLLGIHALQITRPESVIVIDDAILAERKNAHMKSLWNFHRHAGGQWLWQRRNEQGFVREYSATGFSTLAECKAAARHYGYSEAADQPLGFHGSDKGQSHWDRSSERPVAPEFAAGKALP